MSFQDLEEFFDASLQLPIRGKTYVVPSPDATTGLWAASLLADANAAAKGGSTRAPKLDDEQEQTLYERLLGPALDEMVADRVPWAMVRHAGLTALFWTGGSEAAAMAYWNTGGRPEARTPNPETSTDSKASGTSTLPPVSTAGTTTHESQPAEV